MSFHRIIYSKFSLGSALLAAGLSFQTPALAADDCDPMISEDYIQCVMNGVFVVGTWGRAGRGGGIENLIEGKDGGQGGNKEMRDRLLNELKVPPQNIYRQAWNDVDDRSPTRSPSTGVHVRTLNELVAAQGRTKPSYLALIGHSYGGWASISLSNDPNLPKKADLIFLFDPVFGSANVSDSSTGRAERIVSYFQDGLAFSPPSCFPTSSSSACVAGVSCGSYVYNRDQKPVANIRSDYQRWRDGSAITDSCLGIPTARVQNHTDIDDDRFIQGQASTMVLNDVRALKSRSQKALVQAIIKSMADRPTAERLAFFNETILNTLKSSELRDLYRNFRLLQIFKDVLNRLPIPEETQWTLDFIKKGGTSNEIANILNLRKGLFEEVAVALPLGKIYEAYLAQNRNIDQLIDFVLKNYPKPVYTYAWNEQDRTCRRSPGNSMVSNLKCGKPERQITILGANCDVYYNGDYRFTIPAGQDDCPAVVPPPSGPLASGFYKLKNRYSDKCLDVKDSSNKDGAAVQQMACINKLNQAFNVNNVTGDLYTLTAWHSQQCLSSIADDMGAGFQVAQSACTFKQEQNVRLLPSVNGSFVLQFNQSGHCVGFSGLTRANGAIATQADCSGQADQDWVLEPTDPFNNPLVTIAGDTSFEIIGNYSSKCLDIKDGSEKSGAPFQQMPCSGTASQRFQFKDVGDGWYTLQSAASGQCVSAEAAKKGNGTRMVLNVCNETDEQKIKLEPAENQTYTFRFAHSKKCMDVAGTSMDSGLEVHQWDCGSAPDQKWLLNELTVMEAYPPSMSLPSATMCQYKHKKDTPGGKNGQITALDAFGKSKSCDRNGDWKTSCKDGNGDTDEVDCAAQTPTAPPSAGMCQYKHKKDTKGGKSGQTNTLDANGKQKSCNKNADWKTLCKDGKGDTDEVGCI